MKKTITSLLLLAGLGATAQVKIGDNPTTVNASAVLEMESSNKGLLLPRMTTLQRNAIASAATGLTIYNTDTKALEVNTGTPLSPVWSSARAGDVTSTTLVSSTSPAGTSVGQMMYNTGAVQPTGLVYWDGTQWKSVASSGGDTTNNFPVTNNSTVTNNNPVTNNSTSTFNGVSTFNDQAVFNDTAVFNGGMKVGNLPQGAVTDSLMVFEPNTKEVRRLSIAGAAAAGEPWYKVGTTAGATANTDDVYLNGKVGVGTSTPTAQLHVATTGATGIAIERDGTFQSPSRLALYKNNAGSALATGSYIGAIGFYAHNGTGYPGAGQPNADIVSVTREDQTATAGGAALAFRTVTNGTTSLTERMRIDQNGYVGIGTVPSSPFHIKSDIDGLARLNFENTSAGTNNRSDINISSNGNGLIMGVDNGSAIFGAGSKGYIDNRSGGRLVFGTNAVEQMAMTTDGKLGIGTYNPTAKLHISGDASASFKNSIIYSTNTGAGGRTWSFGARPQGTAGDFAISDETSALTRLTIQGGTGNVGIGTNNPTAPLHVATTGIIGMAVERAGIPAAAVRFGLFKNNGTDITAPAAVTNGSVIGLFGFYAHNGTSYPYGSSPNTSIISNATEDHSVSNGGANLTFNTIENGSNLPAERMRIENNGNVGIGTSSPTSKLEVSSAGDVQVTVSTTSSNNQASFDFINNSIKRWRIISTGTNNLAFYDQDDSRTPLHLNGTTGFVGIGTSDPKAPLHIGGTTTSESFTTGAHSWIAFSSGSVGSAASSSSRTNASLIAEGAIWSKSAIFSVASMTFSDKRIKNIIGQSDASKDLDLLNKIRITDYRMKDVVMQGNKQYKKVIAQEVEAIYPEAVTQQTGFVPNIYQLADNVQNMGNNTYKVSFKNKVDYNKNVTGDLKLYDEQKEITAKVVSKGDNEIVFTTTEAINANKLFLFGEEVTDFRAVDYEALSTLNISATQELYREVQALKKQNALLTSKVEDTKKLETAYNELAAQVKAMQEVLKMPAVKEETVATVNR
jgi:hypothetical protein